MARISHRLRLVLSTLLVSGLVFAAVLCTAGALLYRQALSDAKETLNAGLAQVSSDSSESTSPDLDEAHESFPILLFGFFDSSGRLVKSVGQGPIPSSTEFEQSKSGGRALLSEGLMNKGNTLVVAIDWTQKRGDLNKLFGLLACLWVVVLGLVGTVSWYAAKATFKPLQELTDQAASLGGSDLSGRLRLLDGAEFGVFADRLNDLLAKIESTARREEQFAADAAHELRTPLTTLLVRLETCLMQERSPQEYKAQIAALIPDVERLARLVELLLLSTRGKVEAAPAISVKNCVEKTVARWRDRFEEGGVHLQAAIEDVWTPIRPEELESVLDNLLENALRFSPPATTTKVEVSVGDLFGVVKVSDEGPGIAPHMLGEIFDRLKTQEGLLSRPHGGFGIGLSVCRTIVNSRGGSIRAENLNPGAAFHYRVAAISSNDHATAGKLSRRRCNAGAVNNSLSGRQKIIVADVVEIAAGRVYVPG